MVTTRKDPIPRGAGGRALPGVLLLCGLGLFTLGLAFKAGRYDRSLFAGMGPSKGVQRAEGGGAAWDPAPLAALAPETIPGLGWPRAGEIEVFPHDKIADKIDGAIAEYDLYGVQGLVFVSYQDPSKKRRGVDLYIYQMGSRADALGILGSQCPPDVEILRLGEAGWRDRTSVFFRAGSLCVQALGTQPGKVVEKAALALARAVASRAPVPPGAEKDLAPLALLPEEGRIPGSEGYFREDPFDGQYPFLRKVFKADYGETPVTLFAMKEETKGGAAKALAAWRKTLGGKGGTSSLEGVQGGVLGENEGAWEGGMVRGAFLLGVIGADSSKGAGSWLRKLDAKAREVLGG